MVLSSELVKPSAPEYPCSDGRTVSGVDSNSILKMVVDDLLEMSVATN